MSWEHWVLPQGTGREIEPVSSQQSTEDLPSAGTCCQCLDYLLGCLLPVQAGDVGDEAGAEDEDADEHRDPQACGGHVASAGANPAPQGSRSRKGMSPRSVGAWGGHGCLLWGWHTWHQLLFPSKSPQRLQEHSQSTPVCPGRSEGGDRVMVSPQWSCICPWGFGGAVPRGQYP